MKALVLSSGGVDSTTCVAIAVEQFGAANVATLSIKYGQKHEKELVAAEAVAKYYGVPHYVLDLSEVYKYANNPLLKGGDSVPEKSYAEQIAENGKVSTYIPFRNGLFLSAATAFAESIFPNEKGYIYFGAHADDSAGEAYADCSSEFANAINEAAIIGTYGKKKIIGPLISLNKTQVVGWGLVLKAPYKLTWSCYNGLDKPCGNCATCIDRQKAFLNNGIVE